MKFEIGFITARAITLFGAAALSLGYYRWIVYFPGEIGKAWVELFRELCLPIVKLVPYIESYFLTTLGNAITQDYYRHA